MTKPRFVTADSVYTWLRVETKSGGVFDVEMKNVEHISADSKFVVVQTKVVRGGVKKIEIVIPMSNVDRLERIGNAD